MPTRITLGGRLCTTQETRTEDETKLLELKKDLQTQLNSTVKGAGMGIEGGFARKKGSEYSQLHSQMGERSHMVLETQGGNGLVASR